MAPASPDVPACAGLPAAVSAFADAFVDFAVSGIFFPSNPPPPPRPTPTTFLPSPSRLVAIGDLHGDLPKSLTALRLAGLLPSANSPGSSASSTSWSAGPTLAVQLGDILDRGGDELRLLYFLRRLSISAAAQGGALLPILGNHEVMNVSGDFRFVTPQGLQEFSGWAGWYRAGLAIKRRCGGLEQPKNPFLGVPKAFPGIKREFWDGIRSRLAALRPDGPIARRFLADLPTVLVVGDSVFVHGGLLEANVEYGLERINAEVSDWIRGERGDNARAPEYVCGRDAVVWLRRFSEGFNCDCQRLQGVLGMIPGAKRMVMGHTIQSEGINAVCGAQAVRVDVGLSRGCGNGLPEVLEINGGGSEVRVITTDPAEAWQYRKQKPDKAATALEKKGEVKDGLALLVRESHVLKGVEAKA